MVNTARVADLIREPRTEEITEAIEDGSLPPHAELLAAPRAGSCSTTSSTSRRPPPQRRNRHDFEIAVEQALRKQEGRGERGGRRGGRASAEQDDSEPTTRRSACGSPGYADDACGASSFVSLLALAARGRRRERRRAQPRSRARRPRTRPARQAPAQLADAAGRLRGSAPTTQLLVLWRGAGAAYGVPWQVLGAINKIESNFGRNMGPSSAGALGWMQFMPGRPGCAGARTGTATASRTPGIRRTASTRPPATSRPPARATDLSRAIFAYNHAQWYVDDVLELARLFGGDGERLRRDWPSLFASGFPTQSAGPQARLPIDDIEKRIADARKRGHPSATGDGSPSSRKADEARLGRSSPPSSRPGDPNLSDEEFQEVEARCGRALPSSDEVAQRLDAAPGRLDYEVSRLDELRKEAAVDGSRAVTFTQPATSLGFRRRHGLGRATCSRSAAAPAVVSVSHTPPRLSGRGHRRPGGLARSSRSPTRS